MGASGAECARSTLKADARAHADARPASVALVVCLLALVAVASRLPYLATPALWIDESFSVFYAAKGVDAIWGRDWLVDPTPPVYYCLLAAWEHVFGLSEPALRALSLVLTCVSAALIFFIGAAFRAYRGGALAALIWLATPLCMEYSLEIRAYALQLAVICGLLLASVHMLKRYDRAPADMGALTLWGLLVTALALLAFYTHVTSLFAVLGVSLALLWRFLRAADGRAIRRWFVFTLLFLLGASPQVRASYAVVTANHETLAWLPAGSLTWTVWTLRSLFLGEVSMGALAKGFVLAAWLAAALHGAWRLRRDATALALLTLAPALGFTLLVVFSIFVPILLPRTAMWACIPASLLAGLGLARCPRRLALPLGAVFAVMLLMVARTNMDLRETWRSDYRGLAQIAQRDAAPLVVTVDGERACIMAFYNRFNDKVRLLDLEADQVFDRTQNVDLGCNTPPRLRMDGLRRRLADGEAIWIVGSTDPSDDRSMEVETLARSLDGAARVSDRIDMVGFYAGRFEPVR